MERTINYDNGIFEDHLTEEQAAGFLGKTELYRVPTLRAWVFAQEEETDNSRGAE